MPDYSLNMSIDLTWCKCNMLYSRWAAKNGIGYPEMMVLYGLYAFKCSSQKEIAEHCGIVKQTVNTVVHDVEKHGLIEMTPSKTDKRSRIISLTDAGQAYAMEKIGPLLDTEKQICHQIGSDRISSAAETLDLFNVLFERNLNEV